MNDLAKQLQKPFEEADIQWRVQQAGVSAKGNPYVMAIPYVSNRAIQKRLDDIFGPLGWENAYKPTPDGKGYLCGITIHNDDKSVTKWDGGEYTNIEALKGALSDSMKRAAVQLGIGRYLYDLEMKFANCEIVSSQRDAENCHTHFPDKKNKSIRVFISWKNPPLPTWAVPFDDFKHFVKPIEIAPDMDHLRAAYETAYKAFQSSQNEELLTQATEAKDKRKAYIQKNIDKIKDGKKRVIETWLVSEMKIFSKLPTKASVDSYNQKIEISLQAQIKDQSLDCSDLVDVLKAAFDQRINELER